MTDQQPHYRSPFDGLAPEAAGSLLHLLRTPDETVKPRRPSEDPAVTRSIAGGDGLPSIPGYTIHRIVGAGGCGCVYEASRAGHADRVALKLLNSAIGEGRASQRAWRELDFLADLKLDAVPPLLDYGIHEGRLFLATELVNGQDLLAYCIGRHLPRRERVELLVDVAEAVQDLHERGILHRDLKPSNILVTVAGDPRIIDLGIAAFIDARPGDTLTVEGSPIGSPAFMAPEQARGERGRVSTRSDVYSLGATAVLALTGQTPHEMPTTVHESVRRVGQEPPRHPQTLDPSLPDDLAAILQRATDADPDRRYASAGRFAADLRRWLRGEIVEWTQPGRVAIVRRSLHRHPWTWAAAALAVVAIFAGGFGAMKMRVANDLNAALMTANAERERADRLNGQLEDEIARAETLHEGNVALEKRKNELMVEVLEARKGTLGRWAKRLRGYQDMVRAGDTSFDEVFVIAYALRQMSDELEIDDPAFERDLATTRQSMTDDFLRWLWPELSGPDRARVVTEVSDHGRR